MTAISATAAPKPISLPPKAPSPAPAPKTETPPPKAEAPKAEAPKAEAPAKTPAKKAEPTKGKPSSEHLKANFMPTSRAASTEGKFDIFGDSHYKDDDGSGNTVAPVGKKKTPPQATAATTGTHDIAGSIASTPSTEASDPKASGVALAPATPLAQQFTAVLANMADTEEGKTEEEQKSKSKVSFNLVEAATEGEGSPGVPSPGECPPVHGKFALYGDPHFEDGDGSKGDWKGEAGQTYNVIGDTDVQLNGKLAAWRPDIQDGNKRTVVSDVGLVVGSDPAKQDKISYSRGIGTVPQINGQAMQVGQTVTLQDGSTATWTGHELQVETKEYKFRITDGQDEKTGNFKRQDDNDPNQYWLNVFVETKGELGAAADGWLPGGGMGWTIDDDNKTQSSEQIETRFEKNKVNDLFAFNGTTRGMYENAPDQQAPPTGGGGAQPNRIQPHRAAQAASGGALNSIQRQRIDFSSGGGSAAAASSTPVDQVVQASAETANEDASQQGQQPASQTTASAPEVSATGTTLPAATTATGSASLWQALFKQWLASMQASSEEANAQLSLASESNQGLSLDALLPTLMASLIGNTKAPVQQASNPFAL